MADSDLQCALELMTGRWRSQILHAGVKLGLFDAIGSTMQTADHLAETLALDPSNTYRLLRALSSIGLLEERPDRSFSVSATGSLFTSDHPSSLRSSCLWEEGETMYRAWRHLPAIVKEGGADGIVREFGRPAFDLIATEPEVARIFNDAMTGYSSRETSEVIAALQGFEITSINSICDIGGGFGHLLCSLLKAYRHLTGTILEMPAALDDSEMLLAKSFGVSDRITYQPGDMFDHVPRADAYLLKHVLHDWDDQACRMILKNAHAASASGARVLIAEYIVPGPGISDFSKMFDIHMMSVLTGRERMESEFSELLSDSGWSFCKTWTQRASSMAVVEGMRS
jgi:hypothetical protein